MGYTHYWRRPEVLDRELFQRFAADANKLQHALLAVDPLVVIRGWNGKDDPQFDDTVVAFNGDAATGLDHESFLIERELTNSPLGPDEAGLHFEFCKTNQKPYDWLVRAALLVFKRHFGDIVEISSDGNVSAWQPALTWVNTVLGYEMTLPPRIRPD